MQNQLLTKPNKPFRGQFAYGNIFTMRFLGQTFDQIAEKTGYNSSYLRQLFMEGGKLYQPWQEFNAKARESSIDEAYTIMFGKLPDIVRTLANTASMPFEMSGVAAGKTLMEYSLGKPVERVVLNANVAVTTSDLVKRVVLRRKQNDDAAGRNPNSDGVAE